MSTRATYLFKPSEASNGHGVPRVAFYIHYDGYVEGAADYFHNMVACQNDRGGLPGQFVRGNALAEFTGGHESHGDTEYRYTLTGDQLLAEKRISYDSDNWNNIFNGHYTDFINQYSNYAKTNPIVGLPAQYGSHLNYMTLNDAIAKLDHKRFELILRLRDKGWNANNESDQRNLVAATTSVIKACSEHKVMSGRAVQLGDDVGALSSAFAAMMIESSVLQELSGEALFGVAEERGISVPESSFGDRRRATIAAIEAAEFSARLPLEVKTITVKVSDDPRFRPQQYVIPAHIDSLAWMNFGRESCLYTADQIIEGEAE